MQNKDKNKSNGKIWGRIFIIDSYILRKQNSYQFT